RVGAPAKVCPELGQDGARMTHVAASDTARPGGTDGAVDARGLVDVSDPFPASIPPAVGGYTLPRSARSTSTTPSSCTAAPSCTMVDHRCRSHTVSTGDPTSGCGGVPRLRIARTAAR